MLTLNYTKVGYIRIYYHERDELNILSNSGEYGGSNFLLFPSFGG